MRRKQSIRKSKFSKRKVRRGYYGNHFGRQVCCDQLPEMTLSTINANDCRPEPFINNINPFSNVESPFANSVSTYGDMANNYAENLFFPMEILYPFNTITQIALSGNVTMPIENNKEKLDEVVPMEIDEFYDYPNMTEVNEEFTFGNGANVSPISSSASFYSHGETQAFSQNNFQNRLKKKKSRHNIQKCPFCKKKRRI
ncbi:uncharacterized protein LOC119690233 [Teleopsis dalmanni]|uniref:uncharacterized protein LOC119690233 n=1 Tax=Teleopsis dalmanni TaxID=139649 RepID=UPI0018CD3220|nr:uncharacterized protein LOC119690233 [Teleopsis dalmanni]